MSQRDKACSTLHGPWGQTGTAPPPPPLLPTLLGARGRSGSEREKYQGCGLLGLWPLEETGLGRGWGGGRGQPLIFGLLQLFAHINSTIKISTGKKKKRKEKACWIRSCLYTCELQGAHNPRNCAPSRGCSFLLQRGLCVLLNSQKSP